MSSFPSPKYPRLFSEPLPGITDRAIAYDQPGRVKYRGTYWSAKLYQPDRQIYILPNEPVSIIGMDGITLLVVPTGLSLT